MMLDPQATPPKFWFVISGDDFQGPLAETELQNLLAGAAIARDSLAWHSGLENWRELEEFPEFQPYLGLLPVIPPPVLGSEIDFIEDPAMVGAAGDESSDEASDDPSEGAFSPAVKNLGIEGNDLRPSSEASWRRFLERQRQREAAKPKADLGTKSRKRAYLWLEIAAAVAVAMGITGMVLWLGAGKSAIGNALREIDGISAEDRGRLENAAFMDLKRVGPRAAVAVAKIDDFAPYFAVAGNLGDNAKLMLQIEGSPETLVGRFKVSMHTSVTLKDFIAKSPVFRMDNGSTYPLGQYRIRVFCETCITPSVALAETKFFLGREVFAGEYQHQLSAYHAQLRKQAIDELSELKQLSESLENQANETESEFQRVLRLDLTERSVEWKRYHQRWAGFQEQLDAAFSHWTPEALDGAYYYSDFYASLKAAGGRVQANHQAQSAYLNLNRRDASQASAVEAESARIKLALSDLKTKIQKTMDLKVPLEGLPPRLPAP